MIFDPTTILENKKINFEKEWNDSVKYIIENQLKDSYPRFSFKYGKTHPVFETINKLREAYLRLGFSEVMNPLIIDEKEIQKQFGQESLAVLDRCYYIAGLPRPNIGISDSKIKQIKDILNISDLEILNNIIDSIKYIFHQYKKGKIDGDDLIYEISNQTNIKDGTVIQILDEVFPEFKELKIIGSTKTLRSHMTSGWFITIENLLNTKSPPYHLFSIDRCFRREQQEDASRLMTYFSASCIILDENVTIDHGKAIAEAILTQFGFEKFIFKPDSKKSKYYMPGTQIEVYAYHPSLNGSDVSKYNNGWIEVATFGIYSPCALSEYNIPYPVMNFGLGVERLAMILYKEKDMRAITYPQFSQYNEWKIKDIELCKEISLIKFPKTKEGKEIANSIIEIGKKYFLETSPCEFIVWYGIIHGKKIVVSMKEVEENTKLCGPSVFNEIIVNDGNIYGAINKDKHCHMFENEAARTGFTYLNSIAQKVAEEIEETDFINLKYCEYKFKMVKNLSDINLKLSELGLKYITSSNKKIDVRGPLFITISVEAVDN